MIAFVTSFQTADALIDLAEDVLAWQSSGRAEAAIVTKYAAANRNRSIDIGACKPGVNAHSLDSMTKCLAQIEVITVIIKAF